MPKYISLLTVMVAAVVAIHTNASAQPLSPQPPRPGSSLTEEYTPPRARTIGRIHHRNHDQRVRTFFNASRGPDESDHPSKHRAGVSSHPATSVVTRLSSQPGPVRVVSVLHPAGQAHEKHAEKPVIGVVRRNSPHKENRKELRNPILTPSSNQSVPRLRHRPRSHPVVIVASLDDLKRRVVDGGFQTIPQRKFHRHRRPHHRTHYSHRSPSRQPGCNRR